MLDLKQSLMARSIPQDLFLYFAELLRTQAAIALDETKDYLVTTRLSTIARDQGHEDVESFIRELKRRPYGTMHQLAIDAMTTNETSFFRDPPHFEALKLTILPEIFKRKEESKTLTIWSAACSSGQEPYSLAILLWNNFWHKLENWSIRIVASDISPTMLERAKSATYSDRELRRGITDDIRMRYFTPADKGFRVKKELTDLLEFRKMNLADQWGMMPKFDIIFIRNVLIYFEDETKQNILAQAARFLDPEGYLFLGATEPLIRNQAGLKRHQIEGTYCYRKTSPEDSQSDPGVDSSAIMQNVLEMFRNRSS